MDNNNFEQQFSQNVKSTMPAPAPVAVGGDSSKLPLIVAAILGVVTLVESIILIVTLINFFQAVNPEEEVITSEDTYLDIGEDGLSGYDDEGNLIWLNLTCTNKESGDKYVLTESKNFQFSGSSQTDSGTYTITNDSLISLSGAKGNKVIFYDGYSLADQLTVYDCDFDVEQPAESEE